MLDAWPRSKEAIIVSVSHAWEAREHPDPCGYQLEQVVNHASLFVAAFAADIWLFFDYVSLFQFKREKETEEQSFRRSMRNMHAMYAHESTMTFRVESLTPEQRWQKTIQDGLQIKIFHEKSGLIQPVPLGNLQQNQNLYFDRGWCRAEMSWSSVRGDTAQNQRVDLEVAVTKEKKVIDAHLTGRTPVAPDAFAADMHSAAFTHRSDAVAVIDLQEKVFLEKVTKRRRVKVEGISLQQMQALTQSLRHFEQLESITINNFRCGDNEARAFVKAGFLLAASRGESMWVCSIHYLVVICVTCMTWFGLFWNPLKLCPHYNWSLSLRLRWWCMNSCENSSTVIESTLNIDVKFMKLRHTIQLVAMLWFKLFPSRPRPSCVEKKNSPFVCGICQWWMTLDHGDVFFQSAIIQTWVSRCGPMWQFKRSLRLRPWLPRQSRKSAARQETNPAWIAWSRQAWRPKKVIFLRTCNWHLAGRVKPSTHICMLRNAIRNSFHHHRFGLKRISGNCWVFEGSSSRVWDKNPQSFPHASMFINDLSYFKG